MKRGFQRLRYVKHSCISKERVCFGPGQYRQNDNISSFIMCIRLLFGIGDRIDVFKQDKDTPYDRGENQGSRISWAIG